MLKSTKSFRFDIREPSAPPEPTRSDLRRRRCTAAWSALFLAICSACSATGTMPDGVQQSRAVGPENTNAPIQISTAPAILEIRELEALRSLGDGKLISFLVANEDPAIRARAARALGRMPFPEFGSEVTGPLCTALEDEAAEVRIETAMALGLRADPESAGVLLAYWRDQDPRVRKQIICAASKVRTPPIRTQVARSMQDPDLDVRQAAIRCAATWDTDDPDSDAIDRQLIATLAPSRNDEGAAEAPDPEIVWSTLYALQRRKSETGRGAFLQYATSPDVRARIFAIRGLANLKANSYSTRALVSAMADDDWRVVCEAALGLGEVKNPSAVGPLLSAVDHESIHVRTRALEALRNYPDHTVEVLAAAWRGNSDLSGTVRGAAMWTLGEVLTPAETVSLLERAMQDRDPVVRAGAATAAAETLESFRAIPMLEQLAHDKHRLVATTAIDGFKHHINPRAQGILHEFLASPDNGLRLAAISALSFEDNASPADAVPIARAMATAVGDIAPEVAFNGIRCLGQIGGDEARRAVVKALDYPNFFVRRVAQDVLTDKFGQPRALSASASLRPILEPAEPGTSGVEIVGRELPVRTRNPMVDIHTSRGLMTFELFADEAPQHVERFIRLAREDHYDGLSFHRVVPNFVIQGGDYRGDGNGGMSPAGESQGQEFTSRSYVRGSLGMPRNENPDSGGAQIFVTHRDTPHLDERYTLFGLMTAGGSVLDKIEVGDVIQDVLITE